MDLFKHMNTLRFSVTAGTFALLCGGLASLKIFFESPYRFLL
jgi:hypothetical protein